MQFQIKRDTLIKSLSIAHNIIERKNTIPILANVLLETKKNVLSIVATDMDLVLDVLLVLIMKTKKRHIMMVQKKM